MALQFKEDDDGEYIVLGLEYALGLNSDFSEILKSEYI